MDAGAPAAVEERRPRPPEPPSTRTVLRILATTGVFLLLVIAAYRVRSVLLLAVVALFLAIGLDPAVRRLHALGLRRGVAIAAIFLLALLLIVAFVVLLVPPMASQVVEFAQDLPVLI
ncbi:MAG TPA: AI-2E family transporter, partial [Actinomycetota bacterium]|nr:AI-2E family transporter [Actinomycetota bacterium]